ncbi:MAG: hypothetical protein Q9221_007412 [Calogaya cf. arnoldii]
MISPESSPKPLSPNYRGLDYSDWNLATQQPLSVGVIDSKSPPNRIASGNQPTQAFTPQTQAPSYKAFALLDFYFGCALRLQQATASQATPCTATLVGYSASTGKQVAKATFTYTPPGLVSVSPAPMTHAILPSEFNQRLSKVTFSIENPTLVVAVVDELGYELFTS